jgi:hypothetical protein
MEVALFHSELCGNFSIKIFPETESKISTDKLRILIFPRISARLSTSIWSYTPSFTEYLPDTCGNILAVPSHTGAHHMQIRGASRPDTQHGCTRGRVHVQMRIRRHTRTHAGLHLRAHVHARMHVCKLARLHASTRPGARKHLHIEARFRQARDGVPYVLST